LFSPIDIAFSIVVEAATVYHLVFHLSVCQVSEMVTYPLTKPTLVPLFRGDTCFTLSLQRQ